MRVVFEVGMVVERDISICVEGFDVRGGVVGKSGCPEFVNVQYTLQFTHCPLQVYNIQNSLHSIRRSGVGYNNRQQLVRDTVIV